MPTSQAHQIKLSSKNWRKKTASVVAKSLAISLLTVLPAAVITAPGASALGLSDCTPGLTAESITVVASQGKNFYVDYSESPTVIDAGYVGYQIRNTGDPKDLYIRIDSFTVTGGVMSLANADDSVLRLSNVGTETQTAFFLLKATGETTTDQSHRLSIFEADPSIGSPTPLGDCTYTFGDVIETIKASANKLTDSSFDAGSNAALTVTPRANGPYVIGETFTATAYGKTGQIDDGESPDFDFIWLNPSPYSSFPTRSLRLERIEFNCVATDYTIINTLLITNARTNCTTMSDYTVKYTYRVISFADGSIPYVPIAQIPSGGPVKHTTIVPLTLNVFNTPAAPIATTLTATNVGNTTATIRGSFNPNGDTATVYFVISPSETLSVTASDSQTVTIGDFLTGSETSTPVTGLTEGTRYYYQICARNAAGTVCGEILNFTTTSTPPPPPPTPTIPPVNITWPTPGSLTYPTPLSGTQLNAVATCNGVAVTGTYVYTPALGTALDPGTYTLRVTFVPGIGANCSGASASVTIVVKAPEAKITWANPATAEGPVTLGAKELNAVCSVPGTLSYTPAAGTVLSAGTYTLSVTCTPTDTKIAAVTTTVTMVITEVTVVITEVITAPQNAKTSPITFTKGSITWDAVEYAVGYSVDIRGEVVCTTTTATSCIVNKTIGPKTPVVVTAIDKNKESASARAAYFNDKLLTAIEVNFATNKFNIDAKAQKEVNRVSAILKREGFSFVEITGHTDPRGGAINKALSKNRAKSLAAAMTKLVPGLTFKDAGLAATDPKADNKTATGMAKNRRSVGAVK